MKVIRVNKSTPIGCNSNNIVSKLVLVFWLVILFCTPTFSQSKENLDDDINLEEADARMNEVYDQIIESYAEAPLFLKKLYDSQRIWEMFRNAELEMKFPEEDNDTYYGSIYEECAALYLIELTKERTKKLRIWLDGLAEGDVCSGSVGLMQH